MSSPHGLVIKDGWKPQCSADASDIVAVVEGIRRAFADAGVPLPLLLAQTHFSVHGSLLSPRQWKHIQTGLGPETPLMLVDEYDLAAYPACRQEWDVNHFGIGAQLRTQHGQCLFFLVSNEQAYVNLCQLLTLVHHDASIIDAWEQERKSIPDCTGLIVLLQDIHWLSLLREVGAEVYWRSDVTRERPPDGIPLVAAPTCAFLHERDAVMLPVLQALRYNQRVSEQSDLTGVSSLEALLNMPQCYRGYEMAIERGRELFARCRYHPDTAVKLPPSNHDDPDQLLASLCQEGIQKRYTASTATAAQERLAFELHVVRQKQFASYILTVYELAQQRRTCGRGSGASSIICYCLGLTNVDPIRYNLVFERFLAPEREDPPDIDLDFPWDERDDVFAAAMARYGHAHVAMVCTHLHYRKWSAMREVARVHNIKREEITTVKKSLRQANRFGGRALLSPAWDTVFDCAERLLGAPRHYGLHPGGLVITECPIDHVVPTHPSKKIIAGQPLAAIAWEKDGTEDMGLLKIDILGNRSLAVIRDTIQDLQEDGIYIDEQRWRPQDDLATRHIIATGQTMGCFYIESPAMRQLNAKAGSGDFDRLIVHSSIVRPAANNWINIYLERLHEYKRTGIIRDEWFVHPALKRLLSESFGILSYQEDVMLVAKELAGFTSKEQNYLRKSLGRTDTMERLQNVKTQFMDGCAANHIDTDVAKHVWSQISSFAGYSFCKAHSASYAMVSFQCAYLKAHHPAYFMARVISNGGGFYGRSAYVEEARRLGVRILAPCVLRSAYPTVCVDGGQGIRLGLHCIPHVHTTHALRIVEERLRHPFQSFTELYHRCPMSLREHLSIEQAGAYNTLLKGANQRQRRWLVSHVHAQHARKKKTVTIFVTQPMHRLLAYTDPKYPNVAAPDPRTVWQERFQAIRCLPYRHPLCLWEASLAHRQMYCGDITREHLGRRLEVLAWSITGKQVSAIQRKDHRGRLLDEPITSPMSFVTLEDETGVLETTWFPRVYKRYGAYLSHCQPLYVCGQIQVEFGFVSMIVEQVRVLGE